MSRNRTIGANRHWNEMAQSQGFSDEAEMWHTLCPTVKTGELAVLLGYTPKTIQGRAVARGVKLRGRGGVNHYSRTQVCYGCHKENIPHRIKTQGRSFTFCSNCGRCLSCNELRGNSG